MLAASALGQMVPRANISLISMSGWMLVSRKRMKLPEAMPSHEVTLNGVQGEVFCDGLVCVAGLRLKAPSWGFVGFA